MGDSALDNEVVDPHLTTMIVRSYVQHHIVEAGQLSELITSVHRALAQLGQPVRPEEVRTPAVSMRQSVRHDYVVCLDCGYRGKTLRRHISSRHGLSRDEYLRRWGLQHDHLLTAPAYSEQRSTVAKQLGLGRKPKSDAGAIPSPAESAVANGDKKNEAADGEVDGTSKPRRTTRSRSKSDVVDEAASEPTKPRQRRPRTPKAPPQSEPLPTPTADA
jgi:predicted transcriptional regulator